jgi:hypothetical protein
MTVKIGPITARYKGTVKIEEADEQARRAVMRAQARDARGQGTAAATITSTMESVDEGTKVRVETDMRITGPAAQFGRGVMQDVSAKMMDKFAECLAEQMGEGEKAAAPPTPEPAAAPAGATPPSQAGDGAPPPPPGDAAPSPPPRPDGAAAPPPPRPTEEVLDLAAVSRDAVIKRVAPVVVAGLGLLVLRRLLRGRR